MIVIAFKILSTINRGANNRVAHGCPVETDSFVSGPMVAPKLQPMLINHVSAMKAEFDGGMVKTGIVLLIICL